jgi:phage terminase large subunit GpA-like protein
MGFLAPAEAVIARAMAAAMRPPAPPDITRWCEENVTFDDRSPMPGPFRIENFPFLREVHQVLSPEHPCREVTVRGSAQWGKTVSIIQPVLGAWHEYGPLDSLVVHPTMSAATEWVRNKWQPMRRQAPSLRAVFGDGRGENNDATFNQETVRRDGSLKVASAGSPADLTGTSRRLVIMDDLSKYEAGAMGDPEALAVSRASGFEEAKILRVSTPMVEGSCRISLAYSRSDQRLFHVPCPHCGNMAPLTWENFRRNLSPERLQAAHFTCDACGCVIDHASKMAMLRGGRWVAGHPGGDHPGFHLWRAYAPQRDWASIAVEYAQVQGWTRLAIGAATEASLAAEVEATTEQTFYNDVLGLPFAQASAGPDWTALRDRVERAAVEDVLDCGIVPARGVLLTAGVDCQDDRTEVHVCAFGPNFQRWTVDYRVIPHPITEEAAWTALDALLKATWRTERGQKLPLDMLAIDMGAYSDAVWTFAKRHPWSRVILVKGSSSQTGPIMVPQKLERRADGQAKRAQKRAFMLNVSQMKADLYGWLKKTDPIERGFCHFARGLGDEFFRQITAEVRVLKRSRSGVMTTVWDLAEPTRRNEALDTALYAEAAARRKGWLAMTEAQWIALAVERGQAPVEAQADLFDAAVTAVAEAPAAPGDTKPRRRPRGGPGGSAW